MKLVLVAILATFKKDWASFYSHQPVTLTQYELSFRG